MALTIKLLLAVALPALMLAEGLRVGPRDPLYLFAHPRLLARALLSVVVAVPAIAVMVIWVLRPERPVVGALAILAACPVAPLALGRVRRVSAGSAYLPSLHLTFSTLSIVTTPLVLAILGRILGFEARVPPLEIAWLVARSVLLPFLVGVAVHAKAPDFAARAVGPLTSVAMAALGFSVAAILVAFGRSFLALEPRSYLAMAAMLAGALAAGHLLAGVRGPERTVLAMESALRNPALALLIASLNFDPTRAPAVLVPYLVVALLVTSAYAAVRRRRVGAPA